MLRLALPLRRALLSLTLVGLLPLAALTALSLYTAFQAQRHETQRATLDLARAVASAVDAELAASVWALNALVTSDAASRGDLRTLHEELSRFAKARPDVAAISVADEQGHILLRTTEPLGSSPRQAIEPASLRKVLDSATPQVGPIVKGPAGAYVFPIRVPVLRDGRVQYVVTAGLRPERMRNLLERQNQPADWVVAIFDGEGHRVARSRDHEGSVGGPPSPTLQALLKSTASAEGVGTTKALEGDEVVTAFVRLPASNWVVAIGSPVAHLQAVSTSTLILFVLGVGGSLLLATGMAFLLARRIGGDIQHVIDQAKSIGTATERPARLPHTPELAALMHDVQTADRRVRDALEEARRAGAAKDHFLAVLGHELRNPLAPISNVLLLLDRKSDPATAREREILGRQVRHMTRLVDDLLDIARLVEGKLVLRREPIDVGHLVTELAEAFREREPSVRLRLDVPARPLVVDADATRLTQVVTNLLVNAHRHGRGRPITLVVAELDRQVEIAVTDEGDGMTAETIGKVFEPFFQERANAGTLGLGLAIVKAIVERHDGEVRADSAGPGQGSTFTIRLPEATAPGTDRAAG